MPIDRARALSAEFPPVTFRWDADDVIRYHLAIGAGSPECLGPELRYVYEAQLDVLPTFAVLPASAAASVAAVAPGLDYDVDQVLQGAHELEVWGPVPVAGESVNRARVSAVYDKGRFAVVDVVVDSEMDGRPLARNSFRLLLQGEGGFGGARGPGSPDDPPGRPADLELDIPTLPQQAALFRMCADRAAIHIDPAAARAAGLPRPSLPGLCTWGMAAKAVTDHDLLPRGARLCGFAARFAGPVFPGETVRLSLWRGATEHVVVARVLERDAPALSHGRLRFTAAPGVSP